MHYSFGIAEWQQEALHLVSTGIFVKALTPNWVMKWAPTKRMLEIKTAFEELEVAVGLYGTLPLFLTPINRNI